jgi:hypothetical protein
MFQGVDLPQSQNLFQTREKAELVEQISIVVGIGARDR